MIFLGRAHEAAQIAAENHLRRFRSDPAAGQRLDLLLEDFQMPASHGTPGHIVNTASMAGWLCAPLMGVYNVSKHAVVALSETLFHDLKLAQSTIGVTALCPAFVPTGIAESHRNRPQPLANPAPPTASQRMAQAASEKAVSSGRLTASQVAQMTFDAVRENRFYVFTHPQILPTVQARFDAALQGESPADPFATKPGAKPASPAG